MTVIMSLGILWSVGAYAADIAFPPLTGRVVDQAHLLTPNAAQQLTTDLAAQEAKTGQQVVVAIVSSLQGQAIEDYGYQLGRAWGIGQKGKNTGAILLVAPTEHKVRIEVGYGLEGTLTDAKSSDIINGIILPAFKAGDMQAGVFGGTEAILHVLNGQPFDSTSGTTLSAAGEQAPVAATSSSFVIGPGLIFFLIVMILFMRGGSFFWLPLGFMSQSWGSRGGSSHDDNFLGGGGSFGGGGASGSW